MAIFTPSESPAIVTKEIDLSGVVPNVQSTTGAIVGNFRWGPTDQVVKVSDEADLAATFGTPDASNTVDFHSAAYFLRYSGDLVVIRQVTDSAANASVLGAFVKSAEQIGNDSDDLTENIYQENDSGNFDLITSVNSRLPRVSNSGNFDTQQGSLDSQGHTFIARYQGTLGNSLSISICSSADSAASAVPFDDWAYAGSFDAAPGTSSFATARGASNDEVHIAVVDRDGLISGTAGNVLETYPFVSVIKNARTDDGSTNYALDIINSASSYIWMADWDSDHTAKGAGADAVASRNYGLKIQDSASAVLDSDGIVVSAALAEQTGILTQNFTGGTNGSALGIAEFSNGFDQVEDIDTVQVDFLIAPGLTGTATQQSVVNNMVAIAQGGRKDCVVVASPSRGSVVNNSTPSTSAVLDTASWTRSSYLFIDNNYLKVYDKYNDKYIYIPGASSTAGIMAASDFDAAPWFSPAGQRRGNYLGVTSLAYNPTKAQRDELYKAGINPIANIPGQGILLFGDKTYLARPSAFDRINVRRLFLVIERAIALAARNVMFEFNDEFTRAEFVNIVEPFLREIKGRRGITDFRVVCDETNNTGAVIDRNEFIANVFIKPARSINYVTLNFVAVRTGVDFEEVVGTV